MQDEIIKAKKMRETQKYLHIFIALSGLFQDKKSGSF